MRDGCGCVLGRKGGPCSEQFSEEAVLFNLNNCLELTSIQAFTRNDFVGGKRKKSSVMLDVSLEQLQLAVLLPSQLDGPGSNVAFLPC